MGIYQNILMIIDHSKKLPRSELCLDRGGCEDALLGSLTEICLVRGMFGVVGGVGNVLISLP